jgi:HK97 family phage portal protein
MKGGDCLRWWDRLKSAIYGAVTGWNGTNFDFTNWMGRTFWGVDNSTLATNETIFSVITRLSNSLASLPLKLYRNYDLASNQAADVLINSPNPNMTSFEFIRNLETIRNEKGNSYALIERDVRGQAARLTPLNPDYVEPVFDIDTGELWYQVIGNNGTYYFHNMDVLHFKHIIGSGGIKGISPIKVLTNTNDFDKAVREFSLKEMQSAPNSFILKYSANVDTAKRQRVIDDFKRFYQDNVGILFQEPGVEIPEFYCRGHFHVRAHHKVQGGQRVQRPGSYAQ